MMLKNEKLLSFAVVLIAFNCEDIKHESNQFTSPDAFKDKFTFFELIARVMFHIYLFIKYLNVSFYVFFFRMIYDWFESYGNNIFTYLSDFEYHLSLN